MASMGGVFLEDMAVGMDAVLTKTVTDADVTLFAGVSGDFNPIHLDEEYAQATPFKGRIAHGALSTSLISAVLGTRLPGPGAILVTQTFRFRAPVRVGDTVAATAEVVAIEAERKRVFLKVACTVRGKVVVDGDCEVMVPSKAQARPKAEQKLAAAAQGA